MFEQLIRIIPILFIKNGVIVRSQHFKKHQILGDVIHQAERLNDWKVDELICIDISREKVYDSGRDDLSVKSMDNIIDIIQAMSKVCFMPLSFGGGIRSLQDAVIRIRNGADKIILNHLIFKSLDETKKIIESLGSQAVAASLDYKNENGEAIVYTNFGQEKTQYNLIDTAKICQTIGIGELLIQNIELDGTGSGFDLEVAKTIVNHVDLPVITCSGAGNFQHFLNAAQISKISAVAAGNIFNFMERSYPLVKQYLKKRNVNVR